MTDSRCKYYTYIYEGGLKSLYDYVISTVNDFLTNEI